MYDWRCSIAALSLYVRYHFELVPDSPLPTVCNNIVKFLHTIKNIPQSRWPANLNDIASRVSESAIGRLQETTCGGNDSIGFGIIDVLADSCLLAQGM